MISLGLWVHFAADFNRQTTRTVTRSLGKPILRFNRETKFTKTVQNYQKIHGQTNGGGAVAPPPP